MKIPNSKINKTGWVLADLNKDFSKEEAFKILRDFRNSHNPAMRAFRILLSRKIKELGTKDVLISQRLKRSESIILKIKRLKTMKLSSMQDIAGLRVVVDNIRDVYKLNDLLLKSENSPGFKSKRKKTTDYIKGNSPGPKESGYRSLHVIYQYGKADKVYVEIQIRTKLHHAWATAVEIMGAFLNQPLKQSLGPDEILELFKKISKAFMFYEEGKKDNNLLSELKKELKKTDLLDKLKAFRTATKIIDEDNQKKTGKYFLITLNLEKKTISIKRYVEIDLEKANNDYIELEQKFNDKNIDVVLVSVDDIKKLREMYPNYFLDADEFIKYLELIQE